jgi:molecular chaperone DnaK
MGNELQYYFGIDFGTTSIAAVCCLVLGDQVEIKKFGDQEGRPFPAVIAIDKITGKITRGREAKDKRMELSKTCEYISSVKTILDDEDWELEINGIYWTPVDIAAEIFRIIKDEIREKQNLEIQKAVVSIPVGFHPEKRKKLREAAKLAGIDIDRLVSEPTAAYFANHNDLKSSENIIIFDWGGGTLDVSFLKNERDRISEIATGSMEIAGDFLDKKIARRIHEIIIKRQSEKIALDDMPHMSQDILLERCERAKRGLSEDDTVTISINNYGIYGVCRETMDYDRFSDIIDRETDLAIECLENVIRNSGENIANIDRIVMVGGSSNLRPLLEKMEMKFGDKIYFPEETMWNVAQGAALLSWKPGGFYTNQKIGILLSDGSFFELLGTDVKMENSKKVCHFGIVDTNEAVRIIFSGCPDIDNSSDKYRILPVPAYRFLQEQIIIETEVDQDLIFIANARSNMRPDDFSRFWIYNKLKFYYQLDGFTGETD